MRRRDPCPGRHEPRASFRADPFRTAILELMGKWALAAFYDQANNRLRLRFPLRRPSVFWLDRGVCTPLQFPSGMSLIDRKDRTMQNIAEFRIIGRIGKITVRERVSYVSVAANYNRRDGDDWKTDVHWNSVVCF
jgi:hypothetical protein